MKTLVTGGAGFIGGHLSAALASEGAQVDLADNFGRGRKDAFLAELESRPNVRIIALDLCDTNACQSLDTDYDLIVHLAAIIGVRHVTARPYETLRDNVTMTANALEIAQRQLRLSRFLFASTSEVTAEAVMKGASVPTPEDVSLVLPALAQPRTSYMLSKVYGEAMTAHSGVPFAVFRPHNVYGPRMGMSHVIPELLQRAVAAPRDGRLDVYSTDHRRAFCYVGDAVKQIQSLANSNAALAGTFNVGNSDEEVSIGELAHLVCEVAGRSDLTIDPLPATPGSPVRRCPDMAHTMTITAPADRTSLRDGVQSTFDWYKRVFANLEESAF